MKTINLNTLKPNDRNPRKISDAALAKLCESIERDPQFMELRPIVVDEANVILGGNQRYAACLKLGKKKVPASWVKHAVGLTAEQRRRFVVLDNAPEGISGEWDWDILSSDWELPELGELGLDKLMVELDDAPQRDIHVGTEGTLTHSIPPQNNPMPKSYCLMCMLTENQYVQWTQMKEKTQWSSDDAALKGMLKL